MTGADRHIILHKEVPSWWVTATDKHWTISQRSGVVDWTENLTYVQEFASAVTDFLKLDRVVQCPVEVICVWTMWILDANVASISGSHTVADY